MGVDGGDRHGRRALAAALVLPVVLLASLGLREAVQGVAHYMADHGVPEPRATAGFAADPVRGDMVLFGGLGVRGDLGDTWTWDGGGWTRRHPTTSPPAQENVELVWDGTRRQVLLVSGTTRQLPTGQFMDAPLFELWSWDGDDWHRLDPSFWAGGLLGRRDLAVWDAAHGALVLVRPQDWSRYMPVNDEMFVQAGRAAAPPTPAPSSAGPSPRPTVMTSPKRTPAPHAVPTLITPVPPPLPPVLQPRTTELHTWTWDGRSWTDHGTQSLAGGFDGLLAAPDANSGRVELVGRTQPPVCTTWYVGTPTDSGSYARGPTSLPHVPPPPPHRVQNCSAAYSSPEHTCSNTGSELSTEQWEWSGTDWHQVPAPGLPCALGAHTLVSDPAAGHLLLGSSELPGDAGYEFRRWDGRRWHAASAAADFHGRTMATIAADRAHGATLLFGGQRAGEEGNDLWRWNGTRWESLGGTPPPTPAPTDPVPTYELSPTPAVSGVAPQGIPRRRRAVRRRAARRDGRSAPPPHRGRGAR